MPAPLVQVEGGARLRATLKAAAVDLEDLKDVNAAVADLVTSESRNRAPHTTGALAASGRGSRAVGQAVIRFGGARVPYAGVVHYGWPARNITANPFAAEAAADTEPEWLDIYLAGINEVLATVKGA